MRLLHADALVTLDVDETSGYVRYVRTRQNYASLKEVRDLHAHLGPLMRPYAAQKFGLLLDVREAPSRNDESFERQIIESLGDIMKLFPVQAVLIRSAAGRLQVQRLGKTRGATGESVFSDEAEAMAHLKAFRAQR